MEPMNLNIPSYPMLAFIARHGGWLSLIVSAAVVIGGVFLTVTAGALSYTFAGVVGGAFVFIVARTLVEMVRLITDMLLPK
jgi:hypothetical protein